MMHHDDAFLQAILQGPDDDAPRLIFADWLEEHGDPDRAEFIRLQIALARRGAVQGLRRREQELLSLHEAEWAEPLQGIAAAWTFRRGFIDEVRADAQAFAEGAEVLFQQAPVRRLQLAWNLSAMQRARLAVRLADCPHFAKLHSLDLSGCCYLHDYGLKAILVSPYLINLISLQLNGCRVGDAGVRALGRWPHLTRLTHLDLCGNGISGAGVRTLALSLEQRAAGGDPPRLRSLLLHGNPFGEAGRRAVFTSPLLSRAVDLPRAEKPGRGAPKR